MLAISRYLEQVEFSDLQANLSKVLILSTRTSRLLAIDPYSWAKISAGNIAEVNPGLINSLVAAKILVEDSEDELSTVLRENLTAIKDSETLHMVIQPSANCSFGCDYCGQKHTKDKLNKKFQDDLVNHINNKLLDKHKVLSICWFGAEPLSGMNVIRQLSPRLQQIAADKNLKYFSTVVTNGISLTEKICHELVNEFDVKKIEVTLDGTEEFHDQRRLLKTGAGTFNKIYNNLKFLRDNYSDLIKISIRCNVDDRNIENVPEFIKLLTDDSFLNTCELYFAPIHSWGNDADKLIASKREWAAQEIEWLIQLQEHHHAHNIIPNRKKILCIAMADDNELIDPFGNIFKCTEVSLVPSYLKNGKNIHLQGHISNSDNIDSKPINKFRSFYDKDTLNNYPCAKCNIFPLCGGMCPKEWMEGKFPCPSVKYNLKERILLQYIWNKQYTADEKPMQENRHA